MPIRFMHANRKILTISILIGFITGIVVGGLQFIIAQHHRENQLDHLFSNIKSNFERYFSELHTTSDLLQPLTLKPCEEVVSELTSRAAFSPNVRAFLLVRDQNAFCSSATGVLDVPLTDLIPGIDVSKKLDMVILPGTPMMPHTPAIGIWYQNPFDDAHGVFASININLTPALITSSLQDNFQGIALAIGDRGISTFSKRLISLREFSAQSVRHTAIDSLPLSLWLYASRWTPQDIQLALLPALMAGLLAGLLCALLLHRRLRPGRDILQGIKNNHFYVVYQPVVDAGTLQVSGAEVLLRWKHPIKGEISPNAFIPLAEAQKLMVPLTQHLFGLIARDGDALQTVLPAGTKLGINIATGHLHAASFIDDLDRLAASLPAQHFSIVLEITERNMLKHGEAVTLFDRLHQKGYEIAIDDFGTGHSALIYLERFTLDYLKIDRAFVNAIDMATTTSPVLDTVLMLAKRLNMGTVAEGVETAEQAKWLRARGVNYLQGYYFCRPMTLTQLLNWQPPPFSSQLQG